MRAPRPDPESLQGEGPAMKVARVGDLDIGSDTLLDQDGAGDAVLVGLCVDVAQLSRADEFGPRVLPGTRSSSISSLERTRFGVDRRARASRSSRAGSPLIG